MSTGPALRATLLVSCRDRTGLVAALSDFVFKNGGNIIDADQHAELETGLFFMRLCWDLDSFQLDRDGIYAGLAALVREFGLMFELTYSDRRPRVAVFASKAPHCLYDLLLSHQLGELRGDLVVVVSNHDDLRPIAGHFGVRYEHIPVDPGGTAPAEATQQRLLEELDIDLVVLARYMQILSPSFVGRWPGRIINIHHSFLPAFVGARPYHQAKARGVKDHRRDGALRDGRSGPRAHHRSRRLPREPPGRGRGSRAEGTRAGAAGAHARGPLAPRSAGAGLREPHDRFWMSGNPREGQRDFMNSTN